jgi:multiple sugar transport system permease protein
MTESSKALVVPVTRVDRPRPRWWRTPSGRETLWGYVFISPWLIGLVLFTLGPMIAAFVLSLTDFNLVRPEAIKFIGLDNYIRMASDPTVAKAIQVTFVFAAIAIPLTMLSSLTFAALLNSKRLFGKSFFRTLFYMPVQIPLVASTLVWIGFLNTETGWLNQILGTIGLPQPSWLTSEVWIYPALSIIGLWGVGNFMLINLAGMQNVPTELYEAARIDGAGAWKQFRHVTIPMISPILLYNLIIALVGTFQYFTQAYVLTNGRGDPNNATLFINLDLFREAFVYNKMGYGSAIAWLLFVLVMILTLAIFGLARGRVYYAGAER